MYNTNFVYIYIYIYNVCVCVCGVLVVEWLERAVAVPEVSGSISCRGEHKNFCRSTEPSEYVSFRRAVKRQLFNNLKHMIQSQKQHNNIPYKHCIRWNVPTRCYSLPPE